MLGLYGVDAGTRQRPCAACRCEALGCLEVYDRRTSVSAEVARDREVAIAIVDQELLQVRDGGERCAQSGILVHVLRRGSDMRRRARRAALLVTVVLILAMTAVVIGAFVGVLGDELQEIAWRFWAAGKTWPSLMIKMHAFLGD